MTTSNHPIPTLPPQLTRLSIVLPSNTHIFPFVGSKSFHNDCCVRFLCSDWQLAAKSYLQAEDAIVEKLTGGLVRYNEPEWFDGAGFSFKDVQFCLACNVGVALWYFIAIKLLPALGVRSKTPARLAGWIITATGAFLLLVVSIPHVIFLAQSFLHGDTPLIHPRGENLLDRASQIFYIAIAVQDLVLGSLFYPSEVDLLSGWVHHIAYTIIAFYMLRNNRCRVFRAMMLEELPTLLLALSKMHEPWRDVLYIPFGISFILLRVLFHFFFHTYIYTHYGPEMNPVDHGLLIASLSMHLYWAYGFIKSQIYPKQKKKSESEKKQE